MAMKLLRAYKRQRMYMKALGATFLISRKRVDKDVVSASTRYEIGRAHV